MRNAQDNMIGAAELAKMLGMSPQTVKQMARAGEIPSYRRRGKVSPYRFVFEEVKRFLRHRQ